MTLKDTLAELEERRANFRQFRDAVDRDLRRLRAERLAEETAAIEDLMVQAAAEDATLGQIKRAYGTKDHRTVADVIERRRNEIEVIRKTRMGRIRNQPEWFEFTDGGVRVTWEGDQAQYTWTHLEEGVLLFATDTPQWDDTYTIRNEAVALLDGKTSEESEQARILGTFVHRHEASKRAG